MQVKDLESMQRALPPHCPVANHTAATLAGERPREHAGEGPREHAARTRQNKAAVGLLHKELARLQADDVAATAARAVTGLRSTTTGVDRTLIVR